MEPSSQVGSYFSTPRPPASAQARHSRSLREKTVKVPPPTTQPNGTDPSGGARTILPSDIVSFPSYLSRSGTLSARSTKKGSNYETKTVNANTANAVPLSARTAKDNAVGGQVGGTPLRLGILAGALSVAEMAAIARSADESVEISFFVKNTGGSILRGLSYKAIRAPNSKDISRSVKGQMWTRKAWDCKWCPSGTSGDHSVMLKNGEDGSVHPTSVTNHFAQHYKTTPRKIRAKGYTVKRKERRDLHGNIIQQEEEEDARILQAEEEDQYQYYSSSDDEAPVNTIMQRGVHKPIVPRGTQSGGGKASRRRLFTDSATRRRDKSDTSHRGSNASPLLTKAGEDWHNSHSGPDICSLCLNVETALEEFEHAHTDAPRRRVKPDDKRRASTKISTGGVTGTRKTRRRTLTAATRRIDENGISVPLTPQEVEENQRIQRATNLLKEPLIDRSNSSILPNVLAFTSIVASIEGNYSSNARTTLYRVITSNFGNVVGTVLKMRAAPEMSLLEFFALFAPSSAVHVREVKFPSMQNPEVGNSYRSVYPSQYHRQQKAVQRNPAPAATTTSGNGVDLKKASSVLLSAGSTIMSPVTPKAASTNNAPQSFSSSNLTPSAGGGGSSGMGMLTDMQYSELTLWEIPFAHFDHVLHPEARQGSVNKFLFLLMSLAACCDNGDVYRQQEATCHEDHVFAHTRAKLRLVVAFALTMVIQKQAQNQDSTISFAEVHAIRDFVQAETAIQAEKVHEDVEARVAPKSARNMTPLQSARDEIRTPQTSSLSPGRRPGSPPVFNVNSTAHLDSPQQKKKKLLSERSVIQLPDIVSSSSSSAKVYPTGGRPTKSRVVTFFEPYSIYLQAIHHVSEAAMHTGEALTCRQLISVMTEGVGAEILGDTLMLS